MTLWMHPDIINSYVLYYIMPLHLDAMIKNVIYISEVSMMKWEQWLQGTWKPEELICTQEQIWQKYFPWFVTILTYFKCSVFMHLRR